MVCIISVGAVLTIWQCILFSYDYISKSNEQFVSGHLKYVTCFSTELFLSLSR